MRRAHLETFQPRCTVCGGAEPLTLARVLREEGDHVVEGWLQCREPRCQREHPILDGVPQFAPDLRAHVEAQWLSFLGRDDLHPASASWLGDCLGPQSVFDAQRQHVSNYAWDHWGDFDPAREPGDAAPGSIVSVLDELWPHVGALPPGPILEVGCSAGRVAFELATRTGRPVLGADLHQAKLRFAQRVLREQLVRYDLRREGLVYERREHRAAPPRADLVDFWSLDAAKPPFAPASIAAIVALNVLDSTNAPLELLRSCARLLAPGGAAVLACPYDWSASATPLESWLGGHSQRGALGGSSERVLKHLLGSDSEGGWIELTLRHELEHIPWRVRLHRRSVMHYSLHALVLTKSPQA